MLVMFELMLEKFQELMLVKFELMLEKSQINTKKSHKVICKSANIVLSN